MLENLNAEYRIVVEPKEFPQYSAVINESNIIIAPENFSERGQGGIPVRNFVFETAIKEGHKKHWILDDNISGLFRFNNNRRIKCNTVLPFLICEDFTDRFKKIALSGMNYRYFVIPEIGKPPFQYNTRIYSNLLINHEIPFRWRGRYNEDTDLSLRCLKIGWNTILFNAFYVNKQTTLTMKGGNTDTIYNTGDKRREFAESLRRNHPDCVKVVWRYNRWHHDVDYSQFQNRFLEYRDDYDPKENKEYKFKLIDKRDK
jgi:hypothetical protein